MQDLSHLVPSLTNSSEAATNTVSVTPAYGAPGSESESTRDIAPGSPGPFVPASPQARTVLHPSGVPSADPWTRADGSPWMSASDAASPGGETPGAANAGSWGQS